MRIDNVNGHHQEAGIQEIADLLGSSLLELASNFGDFGCPSVLTIYTPQRTYIIIDPRSNPNYEVLHTRYEVAEVNNLVNRYLQNLCKVYSPPISPKEIIIEPIPVQGIYILAS